MAKIGFHAIDESRSRKQAEQPSADPKQQGPTSQELFQQFLQGRYTTTGEADAMVFRTSRELAYECREMCDASLPDINIVMTRLGYQCDQSLGTWTWVLYEVAPVTY